MGRKRVARLMRMAGLAGISRRKRPRTTVKAGSASKTPDLVQRQFTAEAPDRLWVADITYVRTRAGFLYLAVVLDVFSRRVVGWAMEPHLRTELVLQALNMALYLRRPKGVIHHSDQGAQYTSLAFGDRCREVGVMPSMGSAGSCYDNALCESFFASLLTYGAFTLVLWFMLGIGAAYSRSIVMDHEEEMEAMKKVAPAHGVAPPT